MGCATSGADARERKDRAKTPTATADTTALAGKTLQDMGYKDVRNLGGFKGWADSGGAVEKV
jgi:rhodanese-related sulfurtransferase